MSEEEFTIRQLETLKQAYKEAMQEWLDKKFAQFGKWALQSVAAVMFTGFIYLMIRTHAFGTISLPPGKN